MSRTRSTFQATLAELERKRDEMRDALNVLNDKVNKIARQLDDELDLSTDYSSKLRDAEETVDANRAQRESLMEQIKHLIGEERRLRDLLSGENL